MKKTTIKPLGDRVLIREIEEKAGKTKSGIYIPEMANADKGMKRGEVIAVGDGKYDQGKTVPVGVRAGDTILYSWGDKIEIDGEQYTIVRETEISAIVK